MKAIVVGGGIGGLAATLALRQAGIDAVAFEQARTLEEIGAGRGDVLVDLVPDAFEIP